MVQTVLKIWEVQQSQFIDKAIDIPLVTIGEAFHSRGGAAPDSQVESSEDSADSTGPAH